MHHIDKTLFIFFKFYQVFNENYLEYLPGIYYLKFWYHHHFSFPDEKTKAKKEGNVLQGHTTYYSKVGL